VDVAELGVFIMATISKFNDGIGKDIEYTINENGCFICVSHAVDCDGYARITRNKKSFRLHRYYFQLHNGELKPEQILIHTCDNPPCFNPDHLIVGTQKDNIHDMISKGRNATGVENGRSKLDENIVKRIRIDSITPLMVLARKYGVCAKTIRLIKQRKIWCWVE
jgi:hypothetical protein